MSRAQANEILKKLITKYEERLPNPPKGHPFDECYDVQRLVPKEEWRSMYNHVKEECIQLGIPLSVD